MAHTGNARPQGWQQAVGAIPLAYDQYDGSKEIRGTRTKGLYISPSDPGSDAFGRWRISEPYAVFDSKQPFVDEALFWDDQEVSGGSTTSTYSQPKASVTLGVAATTAGKRVRQTYQRMNYQPGKSQLIMMTVTMPIMGTGLTGEVGLFDDSNGLFFRSSEGAIFVCKRSFRTGAAVTTAIAQADWNLDKMDGTGPSGITLDPTTSHILVIDFEWLGVGRVRYGFNINGATVYCHEINHSNVAEGVYMSTPNLPLRYSIENDGTGAAATMEHLCSVVLSEGGSERNGSHYWFSTAGTHVDADDANSVYAVVGMRVKAAYLGITLIPSQVSVLTQTNDDFEWQLVLNPTISGVAPTFADVTNQPIQSARGAGGTGAGANKVTGGYVVAGGYGSSGIADIVQLSSERYLGVDIAGTGYDTLWLCVRPLTSNCDIEGGIQYHALH